MKIHIFFFNRKVRGSFLALCVLRYYTINRRRRSNTNKRGIKGFFSNFSKFRKGIKKGCNMEVQETKKGGIFSPIVYRFGGMAEW